MPMRRTLNGRLTLRDGFPKNQKWQIARSESLPDELRTGAIAKGRVCSQAPRFGAERWMVRARILGREYLGFVSSGMLVFTHRLSKGKEPRYKRIADNPAMPVYGFLKEEGAEMQGVIVKRTGRRRGGAKNPSGNRQAAS